MKVQVTNKHITKGKPGRIHSCPIALAIREQCAKGKAVSVTGCEVSIGNKIYELPTRANEFIMMFDTGEKVKPFTFNLREEL